MELLSISRLAWTWWACASRCVKWISVSRSLETATQIPSKNPGKFVGRISLRKSRLVLKKPSECVYCSALEKNHPRRLPPILGEDWWCGNLKGWKLGFHSMPWRILEDCVAPKNPWLNPPMTPMKGGVNLPRNQVSGGKFLRSSKIATFGIFGVRIVRVEI